MCQKHERRCEALLDLRDAATDEWAKAETLTAVHTAWGRLGGRTTLHRYSRAHYVGLARRRWEKP